MGFNSMPVAFQSIQSSQTQPNTAAYRAWAEVDLGAIRHNLKALQTHFGPQTKAMAVVKANAYGLGAVAIGRTALKAGACGLAVATVEEGLELRAANIAGQILVLGYIPPVAEVAQIAVEADLTLTVNSPELARLLSHYAHQRSSRYPLQVQLKLETGLHRYGLEPDKALELARLLTNLPGLHLQGLYTHFATGDEADPTFVYEQIRRFEQVRAYLNEQGLYFEQEHLANSAPSIALPATRCGLVRIGLAMYGYYPSPEAKSSKLDLRPALTLKSRIARLSLLEPGEGVSYNLTFRAEKPMQIALVPLGYADGFPRALSKKGAVLINGQKARMLGRVMMDQFVVDVTGQESLREGDEIVLIGRQGDAEISLDEVAATADTIPYEILAGLGPRVKRVYTE